MPMPSYARPEERAEARMRYRRARRRAASNKYLFTVEEEAPAALVSLYR